MSMLGDYIRTVREERGLEQQDVAARLGRSGSWLSDIERGRKKSLPEPEELRALAAALGVSTLDLLRGAGYVGPEDLDPDATNPRNPFPAGDVRHMAVERILANDQGFLNIVRAVLALPALTDHLRTGTHPQE